MNEYSRWLSLALIATMVGCVPDRPIAVYKPQCFMPVPQSLYKHACQHGEFGPYQSVNALTDPVFAKPVNSGQRLLQVSLPHTSSYIRYRATRQGQHAIFSGNRGVGIQISVSFDGEELPAVDIAPVSSNTECGEMRWVTGFVMQKDQDYLVEIGPTGAEQAALFFESVETFGAQDWNKVCE